MPRYLRFALLRPFPAAFAARRRAVTDGIARRQLRSAVQCGVDLRFGENRPDTVRISGRVCTGIIGQIKNLFDPRCAVVIAKNIIFPINAAIKDSDDHALP